MQGSRHLSGVEFRILLLSKRQDFRPTKLSHAIPYGGIRKAYLTLPSAIPLPTDVVHEELRQLLAVLSVALQKTQQFLVQRLHLIFAGFSVVHGAEFLT